MNSNDCIFCKIANGIIPSVTVYEDDDFRVILDVNPASRGHALILTKNHYENLNSLDKQVSKGVLMVAAKIGKAMKDSLGCTGYNMVQNNGADAGQTVFHYHVHIIPRYPGGDSMVTWQPKKSGQVELEKAGESIRAAL